ncbi:MAG: sugar kinase [Ignavibacteriales bacterium]|nr:sugar kinase [Ignavibacteriales bacterium]
MSLLVVGSVAIDDIETPFGKAVNVLGGSAVYIAVAASYFTPNVRLVGIVGGDYPQEAINFLKERHIDLEGLEIVKDGKTFHWTGRYHHDLNNRDTLALNLNVFEKFNPKIPESYKKSKYICLGNIDPVLQRRVLEQVEKPKLVVGDTMNFWIDTKRDELIKTFPMFDAFILNDSEARLLTNEPNLLRAARKIRAMGAKTLIIKKGEHGALLFHEDQVFSAPAYPLEDIFDPTGAGDTFAAGFTAWLVKTDDLSYENFKRAVIYGSAMASFCVEKVSVDGLRDLTYLKIQDRFRAFKELSRFEE